jgi:Mce-associated membrane protein
MTTPSDAVDSSANELDTASSAPKRIWRLRWNSRSLLIGALVMALATCCAVTSWLYFATYQPDRQSSPAVADTAIKAASAGTVAVLSYKPDTAGSDFAAAKAHLTGEFLTYYNQFTQQVVTPALQQKGVRTTAMVLKAAVSDLQPDSAVILLFVNQSTSSSQSPEPSLSTSSVKVGLRKVHGDWLISSFDPV